MEFYLAIIVGAMTGFGAAKAFPAFHGTWWLSVPMGAIGGLVGLSLWAEALAPSLQGSILAGAAVAAVIGGAPFGAASAVARRLLTRRRDEAPTGE